MNLLKMIMLSSKRGKNFFSITRIELTFFLISTRYKLRDFNSQIYNELVASRLTKDVLSRTSKTKMVRISLWNFGPLICIVFFSGRRTGCPKEANETIKEWCFIYEKYQRNDSVGSWRRILFFRRWKF